MDIRQLVDHAFAKKAAHFVEISYALIAAEKRPREAGEGEKRQRKLSASFYAELIKGLAFGVIDGVVDIDFAFHLAVHRQAMRQLGSDEDTDRLIGEAGTNAPILNVLKQDYATSFPTVHRLFGERLPWWYRSDAYDGVPENVKWLSHTMWSRWVFDEMKKHTFVEGFAEENPRPDKDISTEFVKESNIRVDERNWEVSRYLIELEVDLLLEEKFEFPDFEMNIKVVSGLGPFSMPPAANEDAFSLEASVEFDFETVYDTDYNQNTLIVREGEDRYFDRTILPLRRDVMSGTIDVDLPLLEDGGRLTWPGVADVSVEAKTDFGKVAEVLRQRFGDLVILAESFFDEDLNFGDLMDDSSDDPMRMKFWRSKVYILYIFGLIGWDFSGQDGWYRGPRDGPGRSDGLVPRDFITFGGVSPLRSKIRHLGTN